MALYTISYAMVNSGLINDINVSSKCMKKFGDEKESSLPNPKGTMYMDLTVMDLSI